MTDKPGKYTSEFGAVLLVIGVLMFRDKLGLDLAPSDIKEMVWAVIAYVTGRSGVKMTGMIAEILKARLPSAAPEPTGERRQS
jgi:hypothetical protein